MPLYEYECKKCGHRFEKIQKFSDKMVKKCPECGGQVEQMISAPAVQFKGSGWYVTDYAKKSSSPGSQREIRRTRKTTSPSRMAPKKARPRKAQPRRARRKKAPRKIVRLKRSPAKVSVVVNKNGCGLPAAAGISDH